jgi:ribonuclease T
VAADAFFSVDVETAGPVPGTHPMLAIGACLVADPGRTFYAEIRPDSEEFEPEALRVSGFSLDHLAAHGEPPEAAVPRFADWVEEVTPPGRRPVFVAFNAPFDWMFVARALHRYAGRNPFGHSALDVKALEMGVSGVSWAETSFAATAARYGLSGALPHHALEDAQLQAELFRRILDRSAADQGDQP